ncbi:unnamed protein product [Prunus armeniaca]|uniref:Uncharacterized protein n=1 Tax=Prunus armeniaca TaxID=36596 RepID=A0A6J5UP74_PRUAR|nr:unnamed protein product [Prunus armeniaca]
MEGHQCGACQGTPVCKNTKAYIEAETYKLVAVTDDRFGGNPCESVGSAKLGIMAEKYTSIVGVVLN